MNKLTTIVIMAIIFMLAYAISYFYPPSSLKQLFYFDNDNFLTPNYKYKYAVQKSLKVDSSDIVFLGNSIIENFEWSDYFGDPRIRNRGIGGDIIKGVINRLDVIGSPAKVFLLIGVNDILRGRNLENVKSDYSDLLKLLVSKNRIRDIYILSVLPTEGKSSKVNSAILDLNKSLENFASDYKVNYIDLNSDLQDQTGSLAKQYSVDGVHLTGDAYHKICEKLINYLR